MEDASSPQQLQKATSVSKRFTYALIGVVTLLLWVLPRRHTNQCRKVDADLQDRLDKAVKLAQVSLALPIWNLDIKSSTFCGRSTAG